MGTGTDVAIEARDLTLVRGGLRAAADAIRLARRTLAVIQGNLFWAFACNVAAIPPAMAGLLNPMIAGAAGQRGRHRRRPRTANIAIKAGSPAANIAIRAGAGVATAVWREVTGGRRARTA